MADRASLFERMILRVVPTPVTDYAPPPTEIAADLWGLERRLRHLGVGLLPTRTTLVRLRDGSLVVISPPPGLDARTLRAIDELGRVGAVVIPNSFHYLYADEIRRHHPKAPLWAAPGLRQRVPGLRIDAELGAPPPEAWAGELELLVLGPMDHVSEVLFFHVPTATLILTDLAFHMVRYPRAFDRLFWRASGIPRGFGSGRTTRSMLLGDRALASRTLSRAMDWPFERIVVSHGDVVERDARSRFERAFARYLTAHSGE